MNCGEIKELLSEYVDEVLDATTKSLVEEHLSTCKACQKEFASLKTMVKELGSLEPVAPPKDFLYQLHERLEQRSWVSKILRTLFIPMRVKIPVEFASAAVIAMLVFSILYIQQGQNRIAEPPVTLKREKTGERDILDSLGKRVQKPVAFERKPASETVAVGQPPEEKEAIELAFSAKKAPPAKTYAPGAATKAAPALEVKMRRSLAMKETVRGPQPERDLGDEDFLTELKRVIELVGGKVASIEYEKVSNRPESILAEIPAEKYNTFYNQLQELGDLQAAPKSVTGKGQEILPVRIQLLSSK